MTSIIIPLFLLLLFHSPIQASSPPNLPNNSDNTPKNTKPLRFVSPLRSLTLHTNPTSRHRAKFLDKFRVGLTAEQKERNLISREKNDDDDADSGVFDDDEGWEERTESAELKQWQEEEDRVERAYDASVKSYEEEEEEKRQYAWSRVSSGNNHSKYQFVGVIQPKTSSNNQKKVMWYARKKNKPNDWSIRLIHADRDAILRDMFVNGKIDLYGEYENVGRGGGDDVKMVLDGEDNEERNRGVEVEGRYTVKERSWRTLWNFNPISLFHDSSGMFWRERRLPSGLYTDGSLVYESAYRYTDGRNGMKPISSLETLMDSNSIEKDVKIRLKDRLEGGMPDVVVEE